MSKILESIVSLVSVIIIAAVSLIGMCLDFALTLFFYCFIIFLIAKCAGY